MIELLDLESASTTVLSFTTRTGLVVVVEGFV